MEKFELFFSYTEEPEFQNECEDIESISDMLEYFDGATREIRRKGMLALYSRLLKPPISSQISLEEHIKKTAKSILDLGGLSLLVHHLSFLTSQLQPSRDLILEQELRILLNLLYATLTFPPQEEIKNEVPQYALIIEESLLSLIKMSTDYSYIPMKKISMVLVKYLKLILDTPVKHEYVPGNEKNSAPRLRAPESSVELFYV